MRLACSAVSVHVGLLPLTAYCTSIDDNTACSVYDGAAGRVVACMRRWERCWWQPPSGQVLQLGHGSGGGAFELIYLLQWASGEVWAG